MTGGNNTARIRQLLPIVREAAEDLSNHLNPNQYPELVRVLAQYRQAISQPMEAISWGLVFGYGVMLENSAIAARQLNDDRLIPPLEDTAQAALDSLLIMHGPLILATAEGRELLGQAESFRLTREQRDLIRADAAAIADALRSAPEIIEPAAAEFIAEAAKTIGAGPHPERGALVGTSTIRNVMIALVSAASLAALVPVGSAVAGTAGSLAGAGVAWAAYERLKKSKWFSAVLASLGSDYDRLGDITKDQSDLAQAQIIERLRTLAPFRRFVIANEEPLRRIAEATPQMRWMLWYITFIVQSNNNNSRGRF